MSRNRSADFQVVTELANAAHQLGRPMGTHVAQVLGIPRTQASNLIASARRVGHNIPPGSVFSPADGQRIANLMDRRPMLRCSDCPKAYEVDQLPMLTRHTVHEHRRGPHDTERTPRLKETAK